jgi:hypothetical protein
MIRKELIYFMIFIILISILVIAFYEQGADPSDPCDFHHELFALAIDSGKVTEKYIDRENHAIKTLVISVQGRDYELLLTPYENWPDFEAIEIDDIISKEPNSFNFSVNKNFSFKLKLDCNYN